MSQLKPELPDYQAFSKSLDEEWLRRHLQEAFPEGLSCPEVEELSAYALGLAGAGLQRSLALHLGECPDCAGLVREMEHAAEMLAASDPLSTRGWTSVLRELFTFWPARLALAGAACAVLVLGLTLGRMLSGPPAVTLLPPLPSYDARQLPSLGLGVDVKPEADRRFHEAMAFYGAPDFPRRALPLLRQAVGIDPDYDPAQFWLGVALLLDGKAPEAIAPLEVAVKMAPGNVIYKQYLAWAYLRTGATNKALVLQTELLKRP